MQRPVPTVQTVLQTVEVQWLKFIGKIIEIPVLAQRQIPVVQTNQKTPQLQNSDNEVNIPVDEVNVPVEQVPHAQFVQKAVAIPQTQFMDRTPNVPSVITQRLEPTIWKVQTTVETLQVQFEGVLMLQRVQWKR